MAVAAVVTKLVQTVYGHAHKHTWAALTNSLTTGAAISVPVSPDRTVQFEGTWGVATVLLEGSNDDDGNGSVGTYHTLHDPLGNAISTIGSAIYQLSEAVLWIRPRVTAADGTTNVVTTLLSKGTL